MIESNIALAHKELDGNIIMVSYFAGPFRCTTERSFHLKQLQVFIEILWNSIRLVLYLR